MHKQKTFKFYSDAGHGWLAVKRNLLDKLRIAQNISSFSYQKGKTVYLEEDSDMGHFLANYESEFGANSYYVKTIYCKDYSPIRTYQRFEFI